MIDLEPHTETNLDLEDVPPSRRGITEPQDDPVCLGLQSIFRFCHSFCSKPQRTQSSQKIKPDWLKFFEKSIENHSERKWMKAMIRSLKHVPSEVEKEPNRSLIPLINSLNLTTSENFLSFDKFVQQLHSQSFLNDHFLEENDTSNYMEMSMILNKMEKNSQTKPRESEESPFIKLQNGHCASYYDQNIFQEFIFENESLNRSKDESKKCSDFESLGQFKGCRSCNFIRNVNPVCENQNHSCISEIHFSKDRYSKVKILYQRKLALDFFSKELRTDNKALLWIREEFQNLFLKDNKNIRKVVMNFKEKTSESLSRDLSVFVKDLIAFLRIFTETISKYYDLNSSKGPLLLPLGNLYELAISITFEEQPEIFKFLFLYQRQVEISSEEQICQNRRKCSSWKPEDFGVSEKYCLTQRTIDYFNKKKILNASATKHTPGQSFDSTTPHRNEQEMVFLDDFPHNIDEVKENENDDSHDEGQEISKVFKSSLANLIRNTVSLSKSCASQKANQISTSRPYDQAIKKLDQIARLKNPTKIIYRIMECAIEILAGIKLFYEQAGEVFTGNIESEEILMIFIYICSQSDCPFLYSKCCLVQNFISQKKAASIYGYYLTTIIAALSCLTDQNFYSRVSKKKNSKRHFMASLRKFSVKCEEN